MLPKLSPIPAANFPILLLSIFAESSSNAGSTDFKSVEAKIASTATADFIFSVKNPASTSAIGVINSIALSFKSIKVAINLLNWLTGTASPTAPYFSSDWVKTSFKTACDFSKVVKSFADLPIACAYFFVAGSNRRIIPNSSSSSGSAFVTPRTRRLKESSKSLPSAVDAPLAAVAIAPI